MIYDMLKLLIGDAPKENQWVLEEDPLKRTDPTKFYYWDSTRKW